MEPFTPAGAKRIVRGYQGTFHDVWQDPQGRKMLACASRRDRSGVAVNWTALLRFREEGGQFVGLMNQHFKVVVPVETLDHLRPWGGGDFIVVRPTDIGLGDAVPDDVPCPF